MLTEDEERHQHDEVLALIATLELTLLGIIAHHVLSQKPSAAIDVTIAIGSAIGNARSGLSSAISRDYDGSFTLNALRDCEASRASREATRWALTDAGRIAKEAARDTSQSLEQMLNGMRESARQGYYQTLAQARRMVNVYGHEKAMQAAITELARNGITAYTYVRKDGVIVHVPVDVALRRELNRAGRDRQTAQTLDIAQRNGMNLIDVSICPDARISHAQWQGKRYQLNGSGAFPNFNMACHVGDMVDGYGGYNCHHTIAIARHGEKYRFQADKERMARLKAAGYDNKRVRELTGQQRALENAIRKEKRVYEVLKAEGLPTKESSRLIRGYQSQLRDLIGKHPQALKRTPWRESVYEKAFEEMKLTPYMPIGVAGRKRLVQLGGGQSLGAAKAKPGDIIIFTDKRFGKKVGKHAAEYGLDPANSKDREEFKRISRYIMNNADEVFDGEWVGQPSPCRFYIKGKDVVIENADGEHVTTMKGGANNARVKSQRNKNRK